MPRVIIINDRLVKCFGEQNIKFVDRRDADNIALSLAVCCKIKSVISFAIL